MKIESIRLKNFKSLQSVELKNLPKFCVIVGANGSGKTTLFSVFEFLKEALLNNVKIAFNKLGGINGFREVRSRNSQDNIEIEIKFRENSSSPLITYYLEIGEDSRGQPFVCREILKYRRGSKGQPWEFLNFSNGTGMAVINELDETVDISDLKREEQTLKSNDILAIKGLAQFERFPVVIALGRLIENWHLSDFHISKARPEQEVQYAESLSKHGENLSLVVQYLYEHHKDTFDKVLTQLKRHIPGISHIEAKTTEEGRVLLKFQDGAFEDPFLARYVSDGTIKMLAYLVLLYDPKPKPLLCVEEPENQLYPKLLAELAEEFRSYAERGGQVFVSTHSPDFLNAVELDEVFYLVKNNGYTQIKRAADDPQIKRYMDDGDKMGYLWREGFFQGVDPL